MIFYRLLCFFYILLAAPVLFAADRYVSPTGSDANPGSFSDPWQTVQYAVDQLQPGDQLYLMPGVYNEKIALSVSGTPANRITIRPYSLTQNAILDGTGVFTQDAMIEITNQSYITISGLEIRNNVQNDAQGIYVDGNCQGIEILNNYIHAIYFSADPAAPVDMSTNAQGIIVFGSDPVNAITGLVIHGNELYDCRLGYSEGIAVNGNVDGFVVDLNLVYDLTNIGIVAIGHEETCPDPLLDQARNGRITKNTVWNCHSPYAACAGIYVDGAKDIQILYNSVRDNDYGIEIGCEHPGKDASGITVRDNIIRLNTISGLAFGGFDYPNVSGSVVNSSVYNNSFWANDTLHDGNGELAISYAENSVIENNLFYTNDQLRAVTFADPNTTTVQLNYNLYYTPGEDQSELIGTAGGELTLAQFQLAGQESNGVFGDPLIVPYDSDESFWLANIFGSPCIDAGNPAHVPLPGETDFFDQTRIGSYSSLNIVDIGATEFIIEGLAELEKKSSVVFPNPGQDMISIDSDENWEQVAVIDLSGKAQLLTAFSEKLDISALKSGLYIVRCSNERAVSYTVFVKL
jgi:hypothetical protein